MIIAITGPTCSGKNTIMNYISEEYGYKKLVTYTTRKPRKGELDGIDYHFISEEEFKDKIKNGEMLEWTGYTGGRMYGSANEDYDSDENLICVLTPSGVRKLFEYIDYMDGSTCNILVLHIDATLEVRARRYLKRCADHFTLTDLEELHNRSERDFGMFDYWGAEEIVDAIIPNDYEGNEDDWERTKEEIDDAIKQWYEAVEYTPASIINFHKNEHKTNKIKTVYVDFDNTLVNTTKRIVDMYNEDYQYYKNFKKINPREVKTYGFKECECASEEAINQYFNSPRFFEGLGLMNNAYDVLKDINKRFKIVVVSMGYSPNLKGKEEWIKKWLPFASFIGCNLKEVKDKSHIDMSDGILIDDSQSMLDSSNAVEKILFNPNDEEPWKKVWAKI